MVSWRFSSIGSPANGVKIIELLQKYMTDMTGWVLSHGDASATFEISSGVKQVCVLAPLLFSLIFTCVLLLPVKSSNMVYTSDITQTAHS